MQLDLQQIPQYVFGSFRGICVKAVSKRLLVLNIRQYFDAIIVSS